MLATIQQALLPLLAAQHPATLLAAGPAAAQLARRYTQQTPVTDLKCVATAAEIFALATGTVFDTVVVAGLLERLDKATGHNVLGRLRDLHARELFVVLPVGDQATPDTWARNELFALGLELVCTQQRNADSIHLYRYSIDRYKTTPDWLNDRNWAHPELFNKHWW